MTERHQSIALAKMRKGALFSSTEWHGMQLTRGGNPIHPNALLAGKPTWVSFAHVTGGFPWRGEIGGHVSTIAATLELRSITTGAPWIPTKYITEHTVEVADGEKTRHTYT